MVKTPINECIDHGSRTVEVKVRVVAKILQERGDIELYTVLNSLASDCDCDGCSLDGDDAADLFHHLLMLRMDRDGKDNQNRSSGIGVIERTYWTEIHIVHGDDDGEPLEVLYEILADVAHDKLPSAKRSLANRLRGALDRPRRETDDGYPGGPTDKAVVTVHGGQQVDLNEVFAGMTERLVNGEIPCEKCGAGMHSGRSCWQSVR